MRSDESSLHPHVLALQQLASLVLFCAATPVALWMLSTLIMPTLDAVWLRGRWERHLELVQRSECAQANLASPPQLIPWPVAAGRGWPYDCARRWLGATIAVEVDADAAPRSRAQLTPTLVARVARAAQERWRDWWPLQRTFLTIATTRALYAVQVVLLLLPGGLFCFHLGAYHAQLRRAGGMPPSAARARINWLLVRQCGAAIPGCCCLPWAIPTVPVLVITAALLLWSLRNARMYGGTI